MIELSGGKWGIFAIPYRSGRALSPVRLPDGVTVEEATPEQIRRDNPDRSFQANLEVSASGRPSTNADNARGESGVVFLGAYFSADAGAPSPFFLLPSGRVGVVYGAVPNVRTTDQDPLEGEQDRPRLSVIPFVDHKQLVYSCPVEVPCSGLHSIQVYVHADGRWTTVIVPITDTAPYGAPVRLPDNPR